MYGCYRLRCMGVSNKGGTDVICLCGICLCGISICGISICANYLCGFLFVAFVFVDSFSSF